MPIPVPTEPTDIPVFPTITPAQVDAALTSAWHELFEDITAPATVINLAEIGEREAFTEWLDSDSIFLPEGSDPSATSTASAPVYRLPKLNDAIRAAIGEYGAVFPKLNWTAPRDAAFLLPQGHGPLHSTTPADVYLLIKSSDFVSHGLGERAYEGTDAEVDAPSTSTDSPLELVLKKYENMNPAREMRCFVRDNVLLGITQRDMNFYEHLQTPEAQQKLIDTVRAFWEDEIRTHYEGGDNYVFDIYVGESAPPQLIDFGPYRAATDPLLFSYEELHDILQTSLPQPPTSGDAPSGTRLPVLKVVDSAAHPAASRAAPAFSTNMMPVEMLQMSDGRTLAEFAAEWQRAMNADGTASDSDSDDE